MRDIVHLPHDLFLIVLSHLPPSTCVLCRAVSRQWHAAFTDPDTCLRLLRWNFPRCREMRLLGHDTTTTPWTTTFAHVARRYHHLRLARPRLIEKLPTAGPDDGLSFRGVATWNRFLRRDDKTCNFHHPDPVWSYSRHDALLVYPRPSPLSPPGQLYHIYDPSTSDHVPVPFDVRGKHVRRVRLAHGVLVFEWAEAHPYHQLNDREFVHRHFVTAFTVSPTEGEGVTFLSEWKLHFLGLPLNRSDRFFSVHNSSHYAAYLWQPNRSLYNDDPIEQLAVWDLSSPSPTPTTPTPTPPTGTGLWTAPHPPPSPPQSASPPAKEAESAPQSPPEAAAAATPAPQPEEKIKGPPVIHRLSWRTLAFYRLRQRTTPQLRELRLDDHNLYLVEEDHWLADGQHSSLAMPGPGGHVVRCTGVPVVPFSSGSSDSGVGEWEWGTGAEAGGAGGVVYGPAWVDECGGPGSGGCRGGGEEHQGQEEQRFAPCWRHAAFPELTFTRVVDAEAGVVVEGKVAVGEEEGRVEVWVDGRERTMEGGTWGALMGKGRLEGEERWILGEGGDGAVTVVRF